MHFVPPSQTSEFVNLGFLLVLSDGECQNHGCFWLNLPDIQSLLFLGIWGLTRPDRYWLVFWRSTNGKAHGSRRFSTISVWNTEPLGQTAQMKWIRRLTCSYCTKDWFFQAFTAQGPLEDDTCIPQLAFFSERRWLMSKNPPIGCCGPPLDLFLLLWVSLGTPWTNEP